MKELIIENMEVIISVITMIITVILGSISKKSKFVNNNIIPLQNIAVGVIFALIEWYLTKDFKVSIALAGLTAGGAYDIVHNLKKLKFEKETFEIEDPEEDELLEDRDE